MEERNVIQTREEKNKGKIENMPCCRWSRETACCPEAKVSVCCQMTEIISSSFSFQVCKGKITRGQSVQVALRLHGNHGEGI